jgi:hypothetical protein
MPISPSPFYQHIHTPRPVVDKSDLKRLPAIATNYLKGRNNPWFLTGSGIWFGSDGAEVLRDLGLGCKLKVGWHGRRAGSAASALFAGCETQSNPIKRHRETP